MTADIGTMPTVPELADNELPEPERRRRRKALFLFLLLFGLLILTVTIIWYLLFRQPIPYLPPIPPTAVPTYATSIYGAERPAGVAVTPSGDRVYVAETAGALVVRVFDGGGNELGFIAPPVDVTGAEHVPVYLAVDPVTSELFVTDRPTGAVYRYDRDGGWLGEYRPPAVARGWQPLAIAFDRDGNVYISDLAGSPQLIRRFDRDGVQTATYGEGDALDFANGLAVAADGRLYVSDSNNGRLLVYEPNGELAATIGRGAGEGNLGLPRGIAVDDLGRLLVVDSSGNVVNVYRTLDADDLQPEFRGSFGGVGIDDGRFSFPMGIAVDARGRVYVADTSNDRVQVWSY